MRKEVADAIIKAMVGVKSADVSPNNLVVRFGEAVDVRATLRPPPPFLVCCFLAIAALRVRTMRSAASLPAVGRASRCQKATRTALISRRSQRATKEHAKSTVSSAGRGHRQTLRQTHRAGAGPGYDPRRAAVVRESVALGPLYVRGGGCSHAPSNVVM